MSWQAKASPDFWLTAKALRTKYSHEEFALIIRTVRLAIAELQEKGHIEETGWSEHELVREPFADGHHFEFHIHDDDVLVVYFKRERRWVIRMVGIYDHGSIPRS